MGPAAEVVNPSFRACIRQDLASSSALQRLLLLATVGWVAYEWGFGNETVTPWILVRVIAETSGIGSVIATAGVAFVFTTLQQLASGHTAAAGFSMFERTSEAAWRKLRSRVADEPRPWQELSLVTRALLVFTLGTTAVVLIQATVTGDVARGSHRRVVNQSAVLCGVVVGLIGAVVAGAVWVGRSVPALESPTSWLLRVLGNPLFWIGLLAIVLAVNAISRRRARAKS